MKFSKNKAKLTTIFVIALLMASVTLMSTIPSQPVQAALAAKQPYSGPLKAGDVANGTFSTDVWISIRPKVIGLGQTVLVNVWATPASNAQRKLLGYHVTITKPDGNTDEYTLDSEVDTAATWMEYVPTMIGEYKYKVEFPGTFCPPGYYNNGIAYTTAAEAGTGFSGVPNYTGSTYYKPDTSPEYTFTVQQEMVPSWGAMAPSTDYWTRPVAPELREWLPIIGDWPWYGPGGPRWDQLYPDCSPNWNQRMDFFPYVQGPSSAHIAWKLNTNIAGITGAGRYATYGDRGWQYEAPASTTSVSPPVITMVIGGRGYFTITRVRSQMINNSIQQMSTTALVCVDIRTGQVFWEVDGFTHSQAKESFGNWQFEGAIEYPSMDIVYLSGSTLCKYDENTGRQTLNVSISPLTSARYYMNGYALGVQNIGGGNYRLINFTTTGTSSNFASRIVSNISWPLTSLPATTDFTAGIAASFGRGLIGYDGTTTEQRFVSVDLKTGQVLANKTIAPAGSGEFMGYSSASDLCDKGIYAFLDAWGRFKGIDIRTGNIVWTSEKMDSPWDANSFGAYDTTSAYGMFYRAGYSGIYAFDWKTGKIVWKYKAPAISPYETPYIDENGNTVYSFNGLIYAADGKLYSVNTEHTPTQPYTRGWQLHCINATTGEGIFKTIQTGTLGAIADGYLAVSESYTGTLWVYGKGKSQTTVEAPFTAVTLGQSLMLKGSVLDLSPAQPSTPCVSKESMATQMEYLHRQMPIGGLWGNETITGVPVSLDTLDPNGNYVHIGVVTTDGYSGTFGYTWEPEVPGQYKVMATFMGDDSYGSSMATTYVAVSEAPPATATPEPTQPPPDNTALLYGILVAVIVAIVIGLLALFRKR